MTLPTASDFPAGMSPLLAQLGKLWAWAPDRPRISEPTKLAWDALVEAWIKSDLPLVIRKGGGIRGAELQHRSGRRLVVADNSPAQWAFTRAFEGEVHDVDSIRVLLQRDEIPFAFATKTAEKPKMRYKPSALTRIDPVLLARSDPVSKHDSKLEAPGAAMAAN